MSSKAYVHYCDSSGRYDSDVVGLLCTGSENTTKKKACSVLLLVALVTYFLKNGQDGGRVPDLISYNEMAIKGFSGGFTQGHGDCQH